MFLGCDNARTMVPDISIIASSFENVISLNKVAERIQRPEVKEKE